MNPALFIVFCIFFVAGLSFLAWNGYRRTRGRTDYLIAGGSTHPFVMAMSYGAAFISTSAIVGFGGVAAAYGLGLQWLVFMNIFTGIFIAFIFFGRSTRRIGRNLNAKTFPEFLALRFASPRLRVLISGIIFLLMPFYASAVLIGAARVLQRILHEVWPAMMSEEHFFYLALLVLAVLVSIYVVFGGLKGVMYADALMGLVMVTGLTSLLILGYWRLGGVVSAHQALTDMAPLVQERLPEAYRLGHRGWTVMPEFNSVWWWTLVSTLMFGVGIGALAQPQLAVRFMTVKSGRELNRAVLIGALFILLTVGSAYLIGGLSNVFFFREEGKLAVEVAGGNLDRIIPLFITRALPEGVLYLFVLTLIAAALSTLCSLYHVIGAAVGHDLYVGLFPNRRDHLGIIRAGVVFGIFCSLFLGFVLPGSIIARATAMFMGVCAAAFLPAYIASVYWKRATTPAVWASIAVGAGVSLFGLVFCHAAEAKALGICKLLTGRDVLFSAHPWPVVDTLCYALPLSLVTLIVVSLLTKAPAPEHIERCFRHH